MKSEDSSGTTNIRLNAGRYQLFFASTKHERDQALRLRFEVFNVELGEGLAQSWESGIDCDEFDEHCDHLLIHDKRSDQIVGTYRMQTRPMALAGAGFYTQAEFQLEHLPEHILDQAVEVGRACIHKDHRSSRVLFLLWKGLAAYMAHKGLRYLFGCCSLTSQDPEEGWRAWRWLDSGGHLDSLQIPAQSEYCISQSQTSEAPPKDYQLPQLFRIYLNYGATVLSSPVIDREFSTIDFLVLLDIQQLDEKSRQTFFGTPAPLGKP